MRLRRYRFIFLVHLSSFYLNSLYSPILRLTYENNVKVVHISSLQIVPSKSETRETLCNMPKPLNVITLLSRCRDILFNIFEVPSLQGYLLHLHTKMCSRQVVLVLMILKTVVSGCSLSGWKHSGLWGSSWYLCPKYRRLRKKRVLRQNYSWYFFLTPVSHFPVRCQQSTFSSVLLRGQKSVYICTGGSFLFGPTM